MIFKVRLKRCRGRRLPWPDVENGPSFEGDLRTYYGGRSGRVLIATLVTPDGLATALLPALHEPQFTGMSVQAFELQGVERLDDGTAVVQEWYCTSR